VELPPILVVGLPRRLSQVLDVRGVRFFVQLRYVTVSMTIDRRSGLARRTSNRGTGCSDSRRHDRIRSRRCHSRR
jgi:hypothetical protein